MKFDVKDNKVQIDICELVDGMTPEEKRLTLKQLATREDVIQWVTDYVCDKDPDGWFTSGDGDIREKILLQVENAQLAMRQPRYRWNVFREVVDAAKYIRSKQHIYYVIYHEVPDWIRTAMLACFERNGVKSQFTTEEANADIERMESLILDAFKNMKRDALENARTGEENGKRGD